MTATNSLIIFALMLALSACSTQAKNDTVTPGQAMLWTSHSAEYQAASRQVYAQATRDLPRLLADKSWSAIPGYEGNSELPAGIILDVDQTVLSGVDMGLTMIPFSTQRQYEWGLVHPAIAVRGGAEFIAVAKNMGIEVFVVTNRPCMKYEGAEGDCPIEQGTINDLREVDQVEAKGLDLVFDRPVQAPGDGIGVARGTIAKGCPFADFERPDQAIVRNFPAFG